MNGKTTPLWCTSMWCRSNRMADIDKVDPDQCAGCEWFIVTDDMYDMARIDIERSARIIKAIGGRRTRCSPNLGGLKHANG
jgi:hypothetical protein